VTRPYRSEGDAIAIGTFLKWTAPQVVELLGLTPLHFAVIEAEHAPFDRQSIDLLILASRAVGLPLLLRPDRKDSALIQSALDCGAVGLLVPHIDTVEHAEAAVASARIKGGTRGYSSLTRAANYGGMDIPTSIAAAEDILVICQIETPEAVANAEAIAKVPGVGGLLVGRADLALAMGESSSSSTAVLEQSIKVCKIARAAGIIAGMVVGGAAEIAKFRGEGVNWFVVSSDQGLMKQAATELMKSAGS
jgi:2-keto-3-deoxy-L-rhamnonate aldolase RhmA